MPQIPFIGGGYTDYSLNVNSQISQNLYPETDKEGGKHVVALYPVPGMKEWVNVSSSRPVGITTGFFSGSLTAVKH